MAKMNRARKLKAAASNVLVRPRLPVGMTPSHDVARVVVSGLMHNAITTTRFSEAQCSDIDLTDCFNALETSVSAVSAGDLQNVEALLMGQAVALNAVFTHLANRARLNMGEHLDAADRYMRLALKAQGHCRATLETLATMKAPPAVFARQANIAHGPQQVNNVPAHPASVVREQNRISGKRTIGGANDLDRRAKAISGRGNSTLAAVGALDGPQDAQR